MVSGTVALEYTALGFLLSGFSRLTLFFRMPGYPRTPVLGPSDARAAEYCPICGSVFMHPPDPRYMRRAMLMGEAPQFARLPRQKMKPKSE